MLGKQQSGGGGIPSDYEVLEYVANNYGDRYAKYVTDFVPTTTCKVEVDVDVVGTTSSRVGAWFGSRSGWNNNAFYFMVETSSTTAGFKSIRSISTEAKWATAGRHTYAIDAGKFVVDGDVIAEYNDDFTPTFPIYIMNVNSAGSSMKNGATGAKLYGCKIYDGGALVRDYKPVKRVSDNVEGIFDVVNQVFVPKT